MQATAEQRLAVQHVVANILGFAATMAEATPKILEACGTTLDWDYGGFWVVSRANESISCIATWQSPKKILTQFEVHSRQTVIAPGVGLTGEAWSTGEPRWLPDLSKAPNFPRLETAITLGLQSGFAFPLNLGQKTVGVIEFFSFELRPPDPDLLRLMGGIGSQIGQFIERKAVERELRESEERYRIVAESASDGIITIDENSIILFANTTVESLFGYQREELIGRNLTVLMPEYLRQQHKSSVYRYLKTAEKHLPWRGVELIGLQKNGKEIPLEISFGEFIKDGRHFFTGIIRDITARKNAERESEKLLAREQTARTNAEESNRLKDEFLATVSHELRAPLNSILGWVSLLRFKKLDKTSISKALEIIERNARIQTKLINDLLDVSRIITGKLKLNVSLVDMTSIIEAAVSTMRLAIDAKEIYLKVKTEPAAMWVYGDPDRLQQVVWNLLANAIKFTPRCGRVEITLRQIDTQIQLMVTDNGQGIEQEFLPYLFERFRQADPSNTRVHSGMGLGLAIVRHLVELHGGTAQAKSPGKGQGATFTITLPVKTDLSSAGKIPIDRVTTTPSEGFERVTTLNGLRILVVDANSDARELIGVALASYGADLKTADSGAQALKLFDYLRPDVLVVDIQLPEMNGIYLINQVRRHLNIEGRETLAIALSSFDGTETSEQALAAGYDVHMSKPVVIPELINLIARYASAWAGK
ncbi:MAG: PAS domain S-box protein [Acidobacteria bacterium]|nr:PAS domain S-box protein [Acidobacteriota bacterium]